VNAICRESAAAAQAAPGPPVVLQLDPALPALTTDAERLRVALVNLIVNARQSMDGRRAGAPAGPSAAAAPVRLETRSAGEAAVAIVIADEGAGIEPADVSRVFDPYFTTKRGGTGLGLPIAKNIVEGLGGSISVDSAPGRGTQVRIALSTTPAGAAGHALS
jgi:signal transduction histidine kinase